eukprot:364100-Chlamydomonas_euryale.AAC.24
MRPLQQGQRHRSAPAQLLIACAVRCTFRQTSGRSSLRALVMRRVPLFNEQSFVRARVLMRLCSRPPAMVDLY